MNSAEKVAKLAWPDSTFLPTSNDKIAFVRENVGNHWTFWLEGPVDVRRAEMAIMQRGHAAAYGRALAFALFGWPPESVTAAPPTLEFDQVARLATASTDVRAKALVAFAEKQAVAA